MFNDYFVVVLVNYQLHEIGVKNKCSLMEFKENFPKIVKSKRLIGYDPVTTSTDTPLKKHAQKRHVQRY